MEDPSLVTHRDRELRQVSIGHTRHTGSEARHDLAVFNQIFGIESVNVFQPGFPFRSCARLLILTIQFQQDR